MEEVDAENNPEDPAAGTRKLPFGREIYIEQDDFREDPPKKFFRLSPGREIRLKHAYYIRCDEAVKDARAGTSPSCAAPMTPSRAAVRPRTAARCWAPPTGSSAAHAVDAEVRLYDKLLSVPDPAAEKEEKDFKEYLNPGSLEILKGCKVEPGLAAAAPGERFQFLRQGYFCADADSAAGMLVFNRSVTLRDSWAKIEKSQREK